MLFALVCSFGIGGCTPATVPSATPSLMGVVPLGSHTAPHPWSGGRSRHVFSCGDAIPDPEPLRQELLEHTRWLRRFLEDSIKMYEDMAAELEADTNSGRFCPELVQEFAELARKLRSHAEGFRQKLATVKQSERELWEQQPGGITAPAPRPKGTPLPPPKPEKVRD